MNLFADNSEPDALPRPWIHRMAFDLAALLNLRFDLTCFYFFIFFLFVIILT